MPLSLAGFVCGCDHCIDSRHCRVCVLWQGRLCSKLGWESTRADIVPKAMALLLAPFKEVAAALFNKEDARRGAVAAVNQPQSNRNFFVCIFWGAEDPEGASEA